ncbi:MAG TPA: MBL fold metallo-hydrolase [Stellaceae bacterium]|nr:MBL fold metallo-hydrolase [Stellaceae bacterium]
MKVTLLGCGGSQGVPSATGDWGACDPSNPRNWRRRPAVLVETETAAGEARTLLIDAPPELREQLIHARAKRIDGVLFTHDHADHIHGIDDLRPFARFGHAPIPTFASPAVTGALRRRFGYAISKEESGPYRPILTLCDIQDEGVVSGIPVVAFPQDHGFGPSTGFRIGNFGYSIDVVRLPDEAFRALDGITHWIVDCQQFEPHPTHSHLAQTLFWIERVRPERAVLTHLGPKLDYDKLAALLPDGVEAGYDGLVLDISDGERNGA